MKKEYIIPEALAVSINTCARPICASTGALSPMEERNDMEGLSWSYN
jgi:hypothetical protein